MTPLWSSSSRRARTQRKSAKTGYRITLEGDEEVDPDGRIYSSYSGRGFAVLMITAA